MADSLVNSALTRLEGMAFDEVKLQTDVGKKVQGLRDDLAWLRLLLRDADQRRRQEINEYIELWVRQTREVGFDAEDLLDEYLHEGQVHCRGVLDLPSFLRWLRRAATGLFVRHSICADIDAIKGRLEQIKKKMEDNNVKLQSLPITTTCDKQRKRYLGWPALNKSKIDNLAGNEKFEQIKDLLTNPLRPRTVVAITGKSGSGKTTLASCVYESSKVWATYHYIIWVHVPKKFRMVDVVADIAWKSTIPGMPLEPEWKDAQSIDELSSRLANNKYLIVLDDVRSLDELELFLSVLPEREGSAVVITMEVKPHHTSVASSIEDSEPHPASVAGSIEDGKPHPTSVASSIEDGEDTHGRLKKLCDHQVELKKLKKKEAVEMFCTRVFGKPSFPCNFPNTHTHAKAIEDLLDNSLPLAGTLLAGLLRTKKEEEWADVTNKLKQHRCRLEQQAEQKKEEQRAKQQPAVQQGETKKDKQSEEEKEPVYRQISLLDQILMLSFDDLPPRLKQCFLYLSAFKAEEHINADKLIRLWVAERLVQPTDGRTMEKHGRVYLKMLISRCLINLVNKDYSNNIISISIHERVLAFATSEAHEINFLQVHHSTTDLPSTAIRRLSVRNAFDPHTSLALTTPKLRSLLCEFPEAPADAKGREGSSSRRGCAPCISKVNSTLCGPYIAEVYSYLSELGGFFMGREVNVSIHQCKFLRVVDLQGMVHLSTLPHEIWRLIYLQYLGLARTGLKILPWSVKDLRNLQTLDITNTEIKQVPRGFWKIKALRHVLACHLKNGPSARRANALNNLQTLHGVHCKSSALKKLIKLRSLGLRRIHDCRGLEDCLRSMECLRSLELEAKHGVHLPLFELLTMHALRNLQHLRLDGNVNKFPAGRGHSYLLDNLTKLELYNSGLDEEHIELIAEVPNLADLILGEGSYIKEHMVIPANGYRKLKKLELNKLPALITWSVAADGESVDCALEQLQQTTVLNCTELTKIPNHLKTLEHLVLLAFYNCPNIADLPGIGDFRSKNKLLIFRQELAVNNKNATNGA